VEVGPSAAESYYHYSGGWATANRTCTPIIVGVGLEGVKHETAERLADSQRSTASEWSIHSSRSRLSRTLCVARWRYRSEDKIAFLLNSCVHKIAVNTLYFEPSVWLLRFRDKRRHFVTPSR